MKKKLEAKNIDVFYGEQKALSNINIGIKRCYSINRSFWMW